MKKFIFFIFIITLLTPQISFAHPGRTDFKGGHTCKTNCKDWGLRDGEYHVHGTKTKEAKTEAKKTAPVSSKLQSR